MYRPLICLLALAALATTLHAAPQRGENLLRSPGFEPASAATLSPWSLLDNGSRIAPHAGRDGGAALTCRSLSRNRGNGAMQEVSFDPPLQHPFRISGWSKSRAADGADYCLYMDVFYADGTNLWGQQGSFSRGAHDWEQVSYVFDVDRPVSKVQYFVLFRKARGEVWFDDLRLELAPLALQHERLLPGLYGGNTLDYFARFSLPLNWTASVLRKGDEVFRTAGSGNAVNLTWDGTTGDGTRFPPGRYTVRVEGTDPLLGEKVVHAVTASTPGTPRRGYAAWTESSMKRVFTHSVPAALRPLKAEVKLARNEYESFQLALGTAPDTSLSNCRVAVSDLKGPGGSILPATDIAWHEVGFVEFKEINLHPFEPEAQPGWWPDPLLPVSRFSVPPATTQCLWFTVFAQPGTRAGRYAGKVTVTPEGQPPLEVPLEVTVFDFDVPTQPHIKTSFALMDSYLERLYGGAPEALRRQYGDFVLAKRLNPDDISRTDPPPIEDIAHYNDRGLNAFNVINMVQPRTFGNWVCWSEPEVYTPAFKASLIAQLDPYVAELKQRGLADKAYVYTFDERGEEFWPIMTEYFGLIKERYGLPTLTTAYIPQDPELMARLNLDWNCPLTPAYDYEKAEQCRAAGKQVWAYVCCGPGYPYANWLADHPLSESRVLWWQAYQQKMDGILYWGLNIWHRENNDYLIDPEKDGPRLKWSITTGGNETWLKRLHGDGDLLYAGKDGPIGCTRLDNIRDGIEDYEYLHLLSTLEGRVQAGQDACAPVSRAMTDFTRDPAVVSQHRERIAHRIEELIKSRSGR